MSRFAQYPSRNPPRKPAISPPVAVSEPDATATASAGAPPNSKPSKENQSFRSAESDPLRRIGLVFALGYIVVRFGTLSEIGTFGFGYKTHLVSIFGPPAVLLCFLSGGLRRALQERPAWFMAAFILWLPLTIPFSVYRRGALMKILESYLTEMPMFFMVAGLVLTLSDVRILMRLLAVCFLINVAAANIFSFKQQVDGVERQAMLFGTIANSNDLAAHLMTLMPFMLMAVVTSKGLFSFWRVVGIPALLGGLWLIIRTGSRGGLVTLMVVGMFVLIRANLGQRVAILTGLLALGVAVLIFMPAMVERFMTLGETRGQAVAAAGSYQSRVYLLQQSIIITLKNPLLGVGPGQFEVAENDAARERGMRRGYWLATHNTYTAVSSETGIPGVVFFTGAFLGAGVALNRFHRRIRKISGLESMSDMVFYTLLSMTGLAVAMMFGTFTYQYYVPFMVGLCLVLMRTLRREIQQQERQLLL